VTTKNPPKSKATETPSEPTLDELPPPPEGDVSKQAEYLLDLLNRLAEMNDPNADRLRLSLLYVIKQFMDSRLSGESVADAGAKVTREMAALEVNVVEFLLVSTAKLKEKVTRESRRMGTGSQPGQQMRKAAENLDLMTKGLELLLAASREGSAEKRREAEAFLTKAKASVQAM
jgi:hypothetical protein